jgi:hypothetical protein
VIPDGVDGGHPARQALLTYRNGPLQNVDIHAVYWGSGVTLPPGSDIPTYLTTVSAMGPFFQMLVEYNVVADPSTYTIGSGTFAGTYVDTDAPLPASTVISNEIIQA